MIKRDSVSRSLFRQLDIFVRPKLWKRSRGRVRNLDNPVGRQVSEIPFSGECVN